MSEVNTRTLKDQLSAYLQRSEAGEQIVVLRDGRPVAALVPLSQVREPTPEVRIAELVGRGLVLRSPGVEQRRFDGPLVPRRGRPAAEMVLEDRR